MVSRLYQDDLDLLFKFRYKKEVDEPPTGSLGLYWMVYSICPLGPSSMSVAPLFPENPEKIVVPTGVSWKCETENVSIFVYKLILHDALNGFHPTPHCCVLFSVSALCMRQEWGRVILENSSRAYKNGGSYGILTVSTTQTENVLWLLISHVAWEQRSALSCLCSFICTGNKMKLRQRDLSNLLIEFVSHLFHLFLTLIFFVINFELKVETISWQQIIL